MRTAIAANPGRDDIDAGKDQQTDDAPTGTERRSRRSFVFFGALAAATMLPRAARAQVRRPRPANRRLTPAKPHASNAAFAEWTSTLGRLVRRATLGITPGDMARAGLLGWQEYLTEQLEYTRIDDSATEAVVAQMWPYMFETSDQLFGVNANTVASQLEESTIFRAAFSQRQLYERMVEFWTDHFNQDVNKVGYLYVADIRDVIRANAMGDFPTLLKASAHSASMMIYLDQASSRGTAPNQNYAREIMELHTLGVNDGYTQTDVAELSRVLTGWTVTGHGLFTFNPSIHDTGNKTVLGVNIQGQTGPAGINEGEQMLDVLAHHPGTARFIATKMLRWLLDPNPTETQISTVASVYRATGGDIKSMLRVILNDSWLPAAPMLFKRPFHYLVSALRSTQPTVKSMSGMNGQLTQMGQQIYNYATPDGYTILTDYWAGGIEPRWRFANVMASQNSPTSIAVDTTAYRAGTSAAAIDLIDQNFFGGEMPATTRTGLLAFINSGTFTDSLVRDTLGLAISANAFQWY
jgi:uncharacterized protein (DUF1800 family)